MDWHLLNIKRKLAGLPALTEADCNKLLDDGASSVSGSDSGTDEEPPRAAQFVGHANQQRAEPKTVFCQATPSPGGGAERRHYAVWSSVLFQDALVGGRPRGLLPSTEGIKASLIAVATRHAHWAVILSRGGHFAAGVFALRSGTRRGDDWAPAIVHKTFHRYVTRQGQGGRQAAQDRAGSVAKSMGSQLRRHNEAALERDIGETLALWSPHLARCNLIFVHAPGLNAAAVFAEGLVAREDGRVRRIPFATARPTFRELRRCLERLAAVEEVAAGAQAPPEAACGGGEAAPQGPLAEGRAPTGDEDTQATLGTTPPVHPQPQDTWTLLHRAAAAGDAAAVARLLQDGQDPRAQDTSGRTPYDVASCKAARDAFRRHMAAAPGAWDYAAAHVPSALTDEMERAQDAKRAAKKAKQRERERSRKGGDPGTQEGSSASPAGVAEEDEVTRAAMEVEAITKQLQHTGTGKKGKGKAGGKTPDPSRRRELLAAAAEARVKALQTATAQQRLY